MCRRDGASPILLLGFYINRCIARKIYRFDVGFVSVYSCRVPMNSRTCDYRRTHVFP